VVRGNHLRRGGEAPASFGEMMHTHKKRKRKERSQMTSSDSKRSQEVDFRYSLSAVSAADGLQEYEAALIR